MKIIKDFLENALNVPVELSLVTNSKYGDFSTNALMKYQLKDIEIKCPSWIEKYEINQGYLNVFISTDIEPVTGGTTLRDYQGRMKDIWSRLNKEGYLDPVDVPVWPDLRKKYNLINITHKTYQYVSQKDIDTLIQVFENYDAGFIYRRQSRETLCSIRLLLEYIITLLERVVYEEHI